MYKKNNSHFQIPLTSHVDELPEKLQKGIKEAWSGTFYKEFFCRIDETPFAVLYADCPSRPNIPVNVLVSLEFLKAGHGWTDEQLYEQYCYNVQVRYAVGYRQLGEAQFRPAPLDLLRCSLGAAGHSNHPGDGAVLPGFSG